MRPLQILSRRSLAALLILFSVSPCVAADVRKDCQSGQIDLLHANSSIKSRRSSMRLATGASGSGSAVNMTAPSPISTPPSTSIPILPGCILKGAWLTTPRVSTCLRYAISARPLSAGTQSGAGAFRQGDGLSGQRPTRSFDRRYEQRHEARSNAGRRAAHAARQPVESYQAIRRSHCRFRPHDRRSMPAGHWPGVAAPQRSTRKAIPNAPRRIIESASNCPAKTDLERQRQREARERLDQWVRDKSVSP